MKKPYIFHSESIKGTPRVTVVGKIIDKKMYLGAALCQPKDPFVRKRGVEIALNRIESNNPLSVVDLTEEFLSHDQFVELAITLADAVLSIGIKPIELFPVISWQWFSEGFIKK